MQSNLFNSLKELKNNNVLIECFNPLDNREFERLEFLGDSVLNYEVSLSLFRSYSCYDQHFLTKERAIIVSNNNLRAVFDDLKLEELCIGLIEGKRKADVIEAILGEIRECIMSSYNYRVIPQLEKISKKLISYVKFTSEKNRDINDSNENNIFSIENNNNNINNFGFNINPINPNQIKVTYNYEEIKLDLIERVEEHISVLEKQKDPTKTLIGSFISNTYNSDIWKSFKVSPEFKKIEPRLKDSII
eukprot:TRINITY_DN2048_c1_g1_i1.p1 TRINITY_DN2048_c1_g1~~TRINITY_DN2048_c1_g1_i1.p1  ORF type:complete len:247 (-),score=39.00 TRINITY_DN2048_c1_g1_i1:148-888(-)